jgi:hypothetical protein
LAEFAITLREFRLAVLGQKGLDRSICVGQKHVLLPLNACLSNSGDEGVERLGRRESKDTSDLIGWFMFPRGFGNMDGARNGASF